MEVVEVTGEALHAGKVLAHGPTGELHGLGLRGAEVVRVGRMGHERADAVLAKRAEKRGEVGVVQLARVAAARVSREERKRGGADRHRVGGHGRVATGR